MYRTFLSLYFLIVTSVISLGWGLDKLWQHYHQEPEVTAAEGDLLRLLEFTLRQGDEDSVRAFAQQLQTQVDVFPLDDLANSQFAQAVRAGRPVAINNAAGDKIIYQQLADSTRVVALTSARADGDGRLINDLFVVLFYGAIALVVFFWVWPLSRDLRKLERQTRRLGKDQLPGDLSFSIASPVHDLAAAFNRMARRIKSLLASHREMTYAVSHELRTPLARMKFGLEMAAECEDLGKIRKQLAGVRQDVNEMDSLINELLTYAGFEQSDESLDLQSGDMGSLIAQLIARMGSADEAASITYHFDAAQENTRVICEWYLMERAVINLMQNAGRFARKQVRVSLEQGDGVYRLCVDDDGPGIPDEDRARIFSAFVRLSNHQNAENHGFGLGLAIVKRILEWHNGSASAGPSPLGGARMCLSWPRPASAVRGPDPRAYRSEPGN